MSTYGQSGVSYGGTGTYGSWGAVTPTPSPGGFRAHGYQQRRRLPGFGHLDITVYLHGEPGPVISLEGEGRARTTVTVAAGFTATSRLRATTGLVTTSARIRTRTQLTPQVNAELSRISDPPDLWLLLDLPELA